MKNIEWALIVIMAGLLFSCAGKSESAGDERAVDAIKTEVTGMAGFKENSPAGNAGTSENDQGLAESRPEPMSAVVERKLIKNGEVHFKTKSLKATKQQINALLKSVNGYIAKENVYDYLDDPQEELVVRVPNDRFDVFLDKILQVRKRLIQRE